MLPGLHRSFPSGGFHYSKLMGCEPPDLLQDWLSSPVRALGEGGESPALSRRPSPIKAMSCKDPRTSALRPCPSLQASAHARLVA